MAGRFRGRRSRAVPVSLRCADIGTPEGRAATTLRARLLGGFELATRGRSLQPASFERPSGLRLLKLLLATPGHRLRREEAAELLWPEADPERSGANLRKAIHFARRGLAAADPRSEHLVHAEGEVLRLEFDEAPDIDVDRLVAALSVVEHVAGPEPGVIDALDVLASLGESELLPDDPYEEWLVPLRERLGKRTLEALLAGAALTRAGGDNRRAFVLLERALARDAANESAHRLVIELHLEAGHLHAARRQLQACRQAVAETYGVEPDPALADLIDRAAAARPAATIGREKEPPIVGRRRELGAAEAAFDAVAAGRSAGVVLRGPAGIGKSRVLRELAGSAGASGWRVIGVRGVEGGPGTAFAAIGEALLEALGGTVPPDLGEPARSAVLTIAPIPDAAGRPPAVGTVDFASDAALTAALVAAVRWLTDTGPIAIVADDAQWLDPGSLGLLAAALGTLQTRPLLLLVAIRDEAALLTEAVAGLVGRIDRIGGETITLGPLGPREIRVIAERDMNSDRLDDDVAAAIAAQSAGTPLFAVELARSGRESGVLELRDGRWAFRRGAGAGDLAVPEGVARLVARRVARLDAIARRILATAAELGDEVAFEELVATTGAADEVLDAVDAAISAGIVVDVGGQYAFSHPLYRAALRGGLSVKVRADVHARIASMLAGDLDPTDAPAIRHAGAAGLDLLAVASHAAAAVELGRTGAAPLAIGFGLAAGERQARLFDFVGAIATLRAALRTWRRLPEAERAAFPVSDGQIELGQALRHVADDPGAESAFGAAIAAARDDRERAGAYAAAAWLPYEHGRFARSDDLLAAGLRAVTDPVAVATLETARGWILGRAGAWTEATPLLARAVGVLEGRGPSEALMRALDRLGVAMWSVDAPERSVPILERAIRMSVELGRPGERGTYEMHLATALRRMGRLDEAMGALDRAVGLCELSGERYIESVSEWIAAEVEQSRGRDAAAIERRRRELAILAAIGGNARHEALAHAHIAHLARRTGDEDLARSEAAAARLTAAHAALPGLEAHVAWSLETEDWFAPWPADFGNATGTSTGQPSGRG